MTQKLIPVVKGYKATDGNMKCRGFQFELDKVFEHKGGLEMCKSGFHFCVYPSGVRAYYNNDDARVFEVEAYDVLNQREGLGTEVKMVAKKIKFIREIKLEKGNNTGYYNTGYYNTGNYNAGDYNAGDWNAGDWNTGKYNTGKYNTGDYNAGSCNAGYYNTGNWNIGCRNTGNYNAGNWNTGKRNTGNCNTGGYNMGDYNAGDGNATNYSSGFFNDTLEKIRVFNKVTQYTYDQFCQTFPEYLGLCQELQEDTPINFEKYKNIPNITEEKLRNLHKKFIEARNKGE